MAQIFCKEPCSGCPQTKNKVKKQSESTLIECSKGHQQRFCQFCWTSTPAKLLKKGVNRPRSEKLVVHSGCTVKGCRGHYIQAELYSSGRVTILWSLKDKPERQPENLPYLERAEELFSEDKLPEVIRIMYREKGTAKCSSAKIITKMKDMKRLGPMQATCRSKLKESWEQLNSNHKLEWIALAKSEMEKEASPPSSNSKPRNVSESIPRWRKKVNYSSPYSYAKQSGAKMKSIYDDDEPCPNSVDEITMMKFSRSSASPSAPIELPIPKKPQSKPSLGSANQFPELKVKLRPIFPAIEEKEEKVENPDWKNWLSATCPDSGDVYYYHKDTNEVTWDKPEKWIFRPKKNEPKRPRAPLLIMSDIERRAPALLKSTNLVPEMQRAIIDLEQEKAELERLGRRKDETIEDLTEKLKTAEQIKKELRDAKWSLERDIADNLQQMNRTEARLEDMEKQRDVNKKVADKRMDEIRYLQRRLNDLNDLRNRRHQGVEQERFRNYHQEPYSGKIEHPPPRYYDQRPVLDRERSAPKPRHNYASPRLGHPEPPRDRPCPQPMINNPNIERQHEGHMMRNDGPRNQIPQRPMPGHVRQPADEHWGRNAPVRGEPFQPRDGPVEGATGNVENFHQSANHAPQSMKRDGKAPLPANYQSGEKQWQVREHQQNNFHNKNNYQQQGGERQQSNFYQQQQPPVERRDNPYNEMHKPEDRPYNQVPAIQHQDVDVRMNNRHDSYAPAGDGEYQGHERPVMYNRDSREGKPLAPENNPYSNYERQAPDDGKPYAQQKPYRESYQSGQQNPYMGRHPALQI